MCPPNPARLLLRYRTSVAPSGPLRLLWRMALWSISEKALQNQCCCGVAARPGGEGHRRRDPKERASHSSGIAAFSRPAEIDSFEQGTDLRHSKNVVSERTSKNAMPMA